MVGQLPEDVGDVAGGHVEPGVPEGQAGELAAGPHQRSAAGGGTEAEGEELVAGAGERRGVRWPMPTGRQGRPGVMLHPRHPRDAIAVSLVPGALGGEERPVLLHVGGDEEPQGGVATTVVRPGLLPMAVSATTGEAASPICIELVGWPDNPAG